VPIAGGDDPKVEALSVERSLNTPSRVIVDERFASPGFFDPRDLVQVKYEMVRLVRVDGEAATSAAAAFGFSRSAFYAADAALARGGLAALVSARPGPTRPHKMSSQVVAFVRERYVTDPTLSAQALAELLADDFGIRVHRRSVERALAPVRRAKGDWHSR
jgi:transposase